MTYEEAHKLFIYCSSTGKLFWRVPRRKTVFAGEEAGSIQKYGRTFYRAVGYNENLFLSHRVIWLMLTGFWPLKGIDHLDGDGLNNRIENLRDTGQKKNQQNRRKNKNNTSGDTGVYWNKKLGKWQAQIGLVGGKKYLGLFEEKEKAVKVYEEAKQRYGFSKRHGKTGKSTGFFRISQGKNCSKITEKQA